MPRYVTESATKRPTTSAPASAARARAPWPEAGQPATREVKDLSFDALPGINVDPLAELRAEHKLDPLKGNRPVKIGFGGEEPIRWTANGAQVPP
jgi:hypothetical protein